MKTERLFSMTTVIALATAGAISTAQAVPFYSVSGEGEAAAKLAEAHFMTLLKPGTGLTETFEGFAAATGSGDQQETITTSVGSFTQTLAGGADINQCDANGFLCDAGLAVLDQANSPFSGRFATPNEGPDNRNWLDSMDSEEMTFSVISGGYTAVGFYMTDPNDVNGRLSIGGTSFSFGDIFSSSQSNGSVFYVSLFDESGLGDITFYANSNNDGYGVDNVTIGRVSEPGTLALMGLGLVGLVLMRRRSA